MSPWNTLRGWGTKGEAICPYCGVGCRLAMETAEGKVSRVRGVANAPANLGGICAKGATLPQVVGTNDRLATPRLRDSRRGAIRGSTWDEALGVVADRFRSIIARHGPDAVAFYGSGQLDTEAVYVAGKLFKGSLGTNNTDSNSRLCMAAAVAGYRSSLGADGPPPCYADIDHADCLLAWGSNMAEAHPVTFDRVKARRKADPAVELIVVDPRRTATAEAASLFVPVRPGGDIPLMNAVGKLLVERNQVNHKFLEAHSSGYETYRAFLSALNLDDLADASGVPVPLIEELAARIGRARAWLSFWCMGLNQSTVGMWKNNSLINLHLLTGQIGRPGAGPFSLTGQPNAMGGREAGMLAGSLPGYRSVAEPADRAAPSALVGRVTWPGPGSAGRSTASRKASVTSSRTGLPAISLSTVSIRPAYWFRIQSSLKRFGTRTVTIASSPRSATSASGSGRIQVLNCWSGSSDAKRSQPRCQRSARMCGEVTRQSQRL